MQEKCNSIINPTIAAARSGANLVFVVVPGANGEPPSTRVRVISTGELLPGDVSIPQRRRPSPIKS